MEDNIQVGQELVYVRDQNSMPGKVEPQTVRVEKVGHKWIHINNGKRLDRESLRADGGDYSSPGRCYLRLQDYQNERAHSIAWGALKKALSATCGAPAGVSTDNILQAMRLLGFAEPKL
jgi:hypothetical protein